MQKYIFSADKNAFFPVELKIAYQESGEWPDDGIEIDDTVAAEFMKEAPEGKYRGVIDGMPAWIDIPPPTKEELVQVAENKRQQLLSHADDVMLDWRTELMLGEISDANRAKLSAWLTYKNDIKATDVTTDPENINWPVPPEV
ncbi:tail fiber assembly protein [Escherichia coli]|uniref:tail fiber assembly protein n=1 Tax=Escherichia coli TaxID=562 RepID=UPI000D020611|nr:tail fiber assembly protein [Escherichia coli]HAL9531822.1 tail fiber assembly protein [Escherichia coli]HBC6426136.1 tail fiber assembly protein [Escherichia coli]HBN1857171.1 tail fiber assembly protein [Escherichia coli]HBN2120249.1 tail fiber assembly protein [Escherichia coli]